MNPEPTLSNRRESPRANAAYSIAYEFFNPGGIKIAEGNAATVNISGRGALIEMPSALDPNGSLILWITAPFYTMLFKGSVMHSRAAPNGMFHIGVRLTDVIEGRWESLEELVQKQLEAAGT
ncbi:MAG: PilZ domain-containing protein [Chloroflexi bacterium]|nr:PilZ domain-containing protein [Chloroflexota bacterium]